jgi:hypothetical protein
MKKSCIDNKQYLYFFESLVGSQATFRWCWQVLELDLGIVCPYPELRGSTLNKMPCLIVDLKGLGSDLRSIPRP